MDNNPPLLFEKRGQIGIILFNRPNKRNAVNSAVTLAMVDAIAKIENDDDIKVAIIGSTSLESFCAGADVSELASENRQLTTPEGSFAGFAMLPRKKPYIAVVTGHAYGGGCEIALGCDIIIGGFGAKFGLPEVHYGLLAGAGGAIRLPKRIPQNIAIEYLLSGEFFDAQIAYKWGLLNHLVDNEKAFDKAIEIANKITKAAPISIKETIKLARLANNLSEAELWALNQEINEQIVQTNDAREGPLAKLQKRQPNWTNS